MSYIYYISLKNIENITTYDELHCHKIMEWFETKKNNKSSKSLIKCRYKSNGSMHDRHTYYDEACPYGRACCFWLRERDDKKACEIVRQFIWDIFNNRKNHVHEQLLHLISERDFYKSINPKTIISEQS